MTKINAITFNGYSVQPKQRYEQRTQEEAELGYILAGLASAAIYKALPKFSNPFLKQISKEHANNHLYKDAFLKSIENSGLKEMGLELIHNANPSTDIGKGLNACYIPMDKQIVLNTEKATISGFHELGHAANHLKGKFGKILQYLRKPGYAIAGFMGTIAVLSRNKPKGEKRDIKDFLQDNCGKIAFIAMLPTVAEETLASYKGIKFAKEAGLSDNLIKNLKKFYGKALLSYGGYALLTGFATYVASKITEIFTRPKKIEENPHLR